MSEKFDWKLYPEAWDIQNNLIRRFSEEMKDIHELEEGLLNITSTRLVDWIDHLLVPWEWVKEEDLKRSGYELEEVEIGGMDLIKATVEGSDLFPIFMIEKSLGRLYLKVEDIEAIGSIRNSHDKIEGKKWAPRRKLVFKENKKIELGAIERRGYDGYLTPDLDDEDDYQEILRRLSSRDRLKADDEAFSDLEGIIDDGILSIGRDRTADAFFFSERRYWESMNETGRIQLHRQNRLGLGWGNHDHHTFRCSRENFTRTIGLLEKMDVAPRERFYAGEQAGWGAQVLEQKVNKIAVFADVDLTPDEKDGDFAHEGLEELDSHGTVGLWVSLHGESIHSAGLHHIAALVDFKKVDEDSEKAGISNMAPFSDFEYLKQRFTVGEHRPPVRDNHVRLFETGKIDKDRLERFENRGAIGSHLEFIERNHGFKGFNQTAVSDIISRTDPRK